METVRLAHQQYGNQGSAVVILHGLFGSSRNWESFARRLSETSRVFTLDLRNHGESPHNERMDFPALAEDVVTFLDQQGLDRSILLGHSMGGKAAMWLALSRPERVQALIVVDIAPVSYPNRFGDILTHLQSLPLSDLDSRQAADAFLSAKIPDRSLRLFLLQNLVYSGNAYRWRINLPAIGQALPTISGFPDAEKYPAFRGETLFIRGANSDYVMEEHFSRTKQLFPEAVINAVSDAGHWVHVEQPAGFYKSVIEFISEAAGG